MPHPCARRTVGPVVVSCQSPDPIQLCLSSSQPGSRSPVLLLPGRVRPRSLSATQPAALHCSLVVTRDSTHRYCCLTILPQRCLWLFVGHLHHGYHPYVTMVLIADLCLLLWLFVSSAYAQAPQDPLKDFCRRYGHQTTIIDRKLYIDGGWLYANPIEQNPVPTISMQQLCAHTAFH